MNKKSVAFLFFLASLLPGASFAAPYGEFLIKTSVQLSFSKPPKNKNNSLKYYGGPVISHAKVFVVFWGPWVDSQIQSNIGPFYQNILDSGYMDRLAQYSTNIPAMDGRPGTGQTIGRGSFIGEVVISPQNQESNLTDGMIQKELEFQISSGVLPTPDADTLYMIYLPVGVSVSLPDSSRSCWGKKAFGGYHEGFKSSAGTSIFYGVIPACSSNFETITAVSSHETIEAITDPFPTLGYNPSYPQAWNSAAGFEAADLCEGIAPPSFVNGTSVHSAVEPWWDNAARACSKGPWSQKSSARILLGDDSRALSVIRQARGLAPNLWDGH